MHRIFWAAGIAALLVAGTSAPSHAAKQAKKSVATDTHAAVVMNGGSCPVSNPALCGGSCPKSASTTATQAAAPVQKVNSSACPVSDPSRCPAGCRPSDAATTTAVAASVRH